VGAKDGAVGRQDQRHQYQADDREQQAGDHPERYEGHPHRHHATQQHDPAVQANPPGGDGAEAEQRGQVEHVGPDDHAGANPLLVPGHRGNRRGDLRGVRGQRGNQTQQGFGQAEELSDPLQPGDEQPARAEANERAEQEGRQRDSHSSPERQATDNGPS
jgi:hypothetical protein